MYNSLINLKVIYFALLGKIKKTLYPQYDPYKPFESSFNLSRQILFRAL